MVPPLFKSWVTLVPNTATAVVLVDSHGKLEFTNSEGKTFGEKVFRNTELRTVTFPASVGEGA
jgi:hypothetical protein